MSAEPSGPAFDAILAADKDNAGAHILKLWSLLKTEVVEGRANKRIAELMSLRTAGRAGIVDKLVAELRRHMKQHAADQAQRERAERVGGRADDGWCEGLEGVAGLTVPDGYWLSQRIERRMETPEGRERLVLVASAPVVILDRLVESGGAVSVTLAWWWRDAWHKRTVGRGEIADARKLLGLAAFGVPVSSENASALSAFLCAWESENMSALPERRATSKLGWLPCPTADAVPAFQWGVTIGGDAVELAPGLAADIAEGLRESGTWADWLEVWQIAKRHPFVALAVYAALVPLFQGLCDDVPLFGIDWAGQTSRGKTTALRVGAAVWGRAGESRPGGLLFGWDNTLTYIERHASAVGGGLPLIIDDTAKVRPADREKLGPVVYHLVGGQGRGRGTVDGVQATARYRTTLLSSGEQPLVSFSEAAGTRARILGLWGPPFTGSSASADAARIGALVTKAHGHLGPRAVRGLQSKPRVWVADRYACHLEKERSAVSDPVASRSAAYVAALATAAELAELCGVGRCEAALDVARAAALRSGVEADRPLVALELVSGWVAGNAALFWPLADDKGKAHWSGYAGTSTPSSGAVGILPSRLREVLEKEGHTYEQVIRAWQERGWLVPAESKRPDRLERCDGRRIRMIVITLGAWQEVAPDDDDAETREDRTAPEAKARPLPDDAPFAPPEAWDHMVTYE